MWQNLQTSPKALSRITMWVHLMCLIGRIYWGKLGNLLGTMFHNIKLDRIWILGYKMWGKNISFCCIGIWIILCWFCILFFLLISPWLYLRMLSTTWPSTTTKSSNKGKVSTRTFCILFRSNFPGKLIKRSCIWLMEYCYLIWSTKSLGIISSWRCWMGFYNGMGKSPHL